MWYADSGYIYLENVAVDVYILCDSNGSYISADDIIMTNTSYDLILYQSFE